MSQRFFLDTEFYEDGKTVDPISIGVVCEDGMEFYAEFAEFDWDRVPADHWLQENVRPHLRYAPGEGNKRADIRDALLRFVAGDKPEFWAYFADYDWLVVAQLFGRMVDLPKEWPYFCLDIKQYAYHLGNPEMPKQPDGNHMALEDARHNLVRFKFLQCLHTQPFDAGQFVMRP